MDNPPVLKLVPPLPESVQPNKLEQLVSKLSAYSPLYTDAVSNILRPRVTDDRDIAEREALVAMNLLQTERVYTEFASYWYARKTWVPDPRAAWIMKARTKAWSGEIRRDHEVKVYARALAKLRNLASEGAIHSVSDDVCACHAWGIERQDNPFVPLLRVWASGYVVDGPSGNGKSVILVGPE